jgi:hypothetical protein
MLRRLDAIRSIFLAVLPLLALAVFPAAVEAGPLIGFRNDTNGTIIVQGMSVMNGQLRLGKRLTIQPGAVAWDTIAAPGNKLITVVDAKQPTRTLLQDTIQCGTKSLFFSIAPVKKKPAPGDKKAPKTPKLELTPAALPTTLPMTPKAPMPRR